jgi:hypothetical protein
LNNQVNDYTGSTELQQLSDNAAAGHAINNPGVALSFSNDAADQSNPTKIARVQASIITLQNLHGPGVGCPAASTTFSVRVVACFEIIFLNLHQAQLAALQG